MKAWIIVWRWTGGHAAVKKPLVNILSARVSSEEVRKYVERYYASSAYSADEQLQQALYNKPEKVPYPARFGQISGVPFGGQITCGHNPFIEAFVANDIRPCDNEFGVCWETTALQNVSKQRSKA